MGLVGAVGAATLWGDLVAGVSNLGSFWLSLSEGVWADPDFKGILA